MKLTEKVTHIYDHYFRYQEVSDLLKEYAEKYPQVCKLESLGQSGEGREIWILKITDLSTGDFASKPAYYLEGNIHAGEVTGTMVCMYFIDTILTNLDQEEVQKMLEKFTIYVVPRVSPDGSEYYLSTPNTVRSAPRMYPYDSLMPGLQPMDLDGDGVIRKMRIKSPYGIWKVSPEDPRAMVKRQPDEMEGEFYNVYSEGMIEQFDGVHIENAPAKFANDFNRNYPGGWQPEASQRGAGTYPLSNPETKANATFLLNTSNVCNVVDMHTSGGQILYTPGFKARKECNPTDIAIYKALGKMANEESGYPVINVHDEYMNPEDAVTYGGFDDFCHFIVGVPAITIECWDMQRRSGVPEQYPPKPATDQQQYENLMKCLKWLDENLNGEGFKTWTKFEHPQLGEVEIGGLDTKFTVQNPPIKFLDQELKKLTNFLLRDVKALPVISFDKVKVKALGEDLYQISATVVNSGFMPDYVFSESLKNRKIQNLKVTIENCEVIEGQPIQDIGHLNGYVSIFGNNGIYGPMTGNTSGCEKKVSWVVKAPAHSEVTLKVAGGRIGQKELKINL